MQARNNPRRRTPGNDPWQSNWSPLGVPPAGPDPAMPNRGSPTIRQGAVQTGSNWIRAPPVAQAPTNDKILFQNEVLIDWARLGYTSARHVDFGTRELPPGFNVGRTLGRSNSVVKEVEVLGTRLAMKVYKASSPEQQESVLCEISILKRLRHHHIIELMGSFTQAAPHPRLSALFWPVAPCSFAEFLEIIDNLSCALVRGDVQLSSTEGSINKELGRKLLILQELSNLQEGAGNNRPVPLGKTLRAAICRIFGSFGCLAEALLYIHRQRVSHKDIKPSNIFIYPRRASYQSTESHPDGQRVNDGIRLGDFDGAKDIAQNDISEVPHDRYTGRYASPETHITGKSGRAADIFSMGCVYLEMMAPITIYLWLISQDQPNLDSYWSRGKINLGMSRTNHYATLAGNGELPNLVDQVAEGLPSGTSGGLRPIVHSMLANNASARPSADQVLLSLSAAETLQDLGNLPKKSFPPYPYFGRCCTKFSLDVKAAKILSPLLAAQCNASETNFPQPLVKADSVESNWAVNAWGAHVDADVYTDPHEDEDGNPNENQDLESEEMATAIRVPAELEREWIALNRSDQRIDPPPVPFNKALYDKVKKMKLCQYRYLLGICNEPETCEQKYGTRHNVPVTDTELEVFRALRRGQTVCSTDCRNPICFSGHNCPFMDVEARVEDRTKTAICVYGGTGRRCRFPEDMHDMDLKVVRYLYR